MPARYCALLFAGSEDELLNLLKEDDEIVKDGILNLLAMAGEIICEGLASSSTLVDLILEGVCSGGSRRQANYDVSALSAITEDGRLQSLYKKAKDLKKEHWNGLSGNCQLKACCQVAMPIPAIIQFFTTSSVEAQVTPDVG